MDKNWQTRKVKIGKVVIGGGLPVAVQTMTNTDTKDIVATVEQIKRLVDAGADIVRMTVPGKAEAKACEKIKSSLCRQGCDVPLVADIHFYPPAALLAAEFLDKIRINPGNFADPRARFQKKSYTQEEFFLGKARIEEKFTPLVLLCKKNKVAMRIGVNHGSLSDRIMNVYGDTPKGMVESAIEFAVICRKQNYHDLVFSMKSSNPRLMIEAHLLLVETMQTLGWDYPIHLGVTEAGAGLDGAVKSFLGIGSLLSRGIGDTIRISLTEDPEKEIAPAKKLVQYSLEKRKPQQSFPFFSKKQGKRGSFSFIFPLREKDMEKESLLFSLLSIKKTSLGYEKSIDSPDAILLETPQKERSFFSKVLEAGIAIFHPTEKITSHYEILPSSTICFAQERSLKRAFLPAEKRYYELFSSDRSDLHLSHIFAPAEKIQDLKENRTSKGQGSSKHQWIATANYTKEELLLGACLPVGSLLLGGWVDGICLGSDCSRKELKECTLSLLQAARLRSVKTEFISCPGCGRTLFNLEEVTEIIRKKTGHLPGVHIAVMGCIVNGPGEMADADFGYVGSSPGKIDLYVGKTKVKKQVDFQDAEKELIALIKKHGKWVEPTKTS